MPRGRALGSELRVGSRQGPAHGGRGRRTQTPARSRWCRKSSAAASCALYGSEDVVGVEIGGALKNVIAIAAGVVEGMGLGHNAQAALVTRGLAEITRLASALGGGARRWRDWRGLATSC